MNDPSEGTALGDVGRLLDVQSILDVCVQVTGMRYAVVAHVTEERWLACAVLDKVEFGLPVGGELPIETTLCNEVRAGRTTIAFDHASSDDRWRDHSTPKMYGLESYIAAPIVLSNGEFFGTLCAIDPEPASASAPATIQMFELFSKLIASQIEAGRRVASSEAALLDAQSTAELRDQFIAVLGHDLRNPLAAIDAGATLLDRRITGERERLILIEMRRSVRRMERLINDILDFARGRLGGGLKVAPRSASELPQMLGEVVEELRAANPHRNFDVEIALSTPVRGDPDRIAQLASNLLANAIAHGDQTQPIGFRAITTAFQFELAVANGGPPIPEAVRPRLFRPFSRGGTGAVREGLGLGLYIVSQIAKAHGGDVEIESGGSGTRFVFRMPLGADDEPEPPGRLAPEIADSSDV